MEQIKMKQSGKYDLPLTIVSLAILFTFVGFMFVKPDITLNGVSSAFDAIIKITGSVLLVFTLFTLCVSIYLGAGKYADIKFGDEKPEYSLFSYIAMMTLAALASAALYWSFTEWTYYYTTPGLGMEPESIEALESSLGYQFFHWGISGQCVYVCIGAAMAYAFYIRKVPLLQTSSVCCAMMGEFKGKSFVGKLIDFCVIFGIVGGLGCSLGLAVPLAGGALTKLFGIEVTGPVKIGIVVVIALVFTFTSFIGTKKGMKNLSNITAGLCIVYLIYVFLVGPTTFIMKNTVNSFGWMIFEFPRMSLYTDPVTNSGFPESWTLFFQAFYLNYAAMMGIFVAKISKGRTLRQLVWATLLGISAGGWFLFAINGNFSIHSHITGLSDIVALANSGVGERGIFDVVALLPGGSVLLPVVLLIVIVGFVASSLDSASLSLAQTTTKMTENDGEVNKWFRVFWCFVLTLVPLSILLANASFSALKNLSILISIPFMVIVAFMEIKLLKWLSEDRKAGRLEKYGIK
ncbi:BCCT family transporter [Sinanaerobacter chloroacetimidivorans]|uniref:BCCT family transporter n=1 Tax=Sinanaerobacter chloroacetimidivorans TaxID=2818044 RepID=A0A8J7W1A0_9FIRM|nr:BCCT family transporter [Sinanaerobacter chloroacetimidivorans]MBR0597360.1 BCCT family transporter [Sinanaerobacter chloroacetimidivorans]